MRFFRHAHCEQKARFAYGAQRNEERKEMARTSLDSQPPLPEEVFGHPYHYLQLVPLVADALT
jgi:hypothetical protein